MSRFVLDSNNLWLIAVSDGTIRVLEGPYEPDLNTHDLRGDLRGKWKQMARIGTTPESTHRELEVFGVAFSGQKQEELRKIAWDHQLAINREGFMVQWLNPGGGDRVPNDDSLYRRLNDLFDWSKHGVEVPAPVRTEWDRYQLATGKLMAENLGLANLMQVIKELEEENQALRDEKDMEIRELKKQVEEKGGGGGKNPADKDAELAAKDEQIRVLKEALKLFL